MVVLGLYFILATAYGVWRIGKRTIFEGKHFLRLLVWSIPLPLIACQLGWMAAEVGRQPWAVYGVLRTTDAFSTNLSVPVLLFSICLFAAIYILLGTLYVYLLVKKVRHGPDPIQGDDSAVVPDEGQAQKEKELVPA
jgi:cytochrome d ubiquinol oxidase subunit I